MVIARVAFMILVLFMALVFGLLVIERVGTEVQLESPAVGPQSKNQSAKAETF